MTVCARGRALFAVGRCHLFFFRARRAVAVRCLTHASFHFATSIFGRRTRQAVNLRDTGCLEQMPWIYFHLFNGSPHFFSFSLCAAPSLLTCRLNRPRRIVSHKTVLRPTMLLRSMDALRFVGMCASCHIMLSYFKIEYYCHQSELGRFAANSVCVKWFFIFFIYLKGRRKKKQWS